MEKKPHGGFCQTMGFTYIFFSIAALQFCSLCLFFYHVYVHTDIQWEETSVLSLCLMSLSQSTGNASTEKKSLRFQSAVLKYQLYFLHLVHLVFPPLSSSWLVTFAGPFVQL